ncbi:MAG: class I SAM-dependent methyltransferase [Firmicutes bacterium]|nr:class I SAM-dependent methyltransferase [Bacillota bacterium]
MSKCKICGHETISYHHPKTKILFHECLNCEFIFKDKLHHASQAQELKKYDEHQNNLQDVGYVNFLTDFIQSAVYPYIKEGKVLDFGSGPTPVLAAILKDQYHFDVDIYDLYYASTKIYENQIYDLITTTEVIEHLSNPIQAFQLFYDHLKPSGILSVMTLFHPKNQEQFFDWHYVRDLTHISFFTLKTMKVIAQNLNFELLDTNDYRYVVLKKK